MKFFHADAGAFRDLVSISQNEKTNDGCGGFVDNWQTQGAVWARISPANAAERFIGDRRDEQRTHIVDVRQPLEIAQGWRLSTQNPERFFEVLTVYDPDETNRYWRCECRVVV